ncbi:MAG: L-rhamnose/proton symporter RhaT [Verrucomicrobiota bacterium]
MNPILGVLFHWIGGLASGSFYVPYRRVRLWSWETYWLVGGFFSWIIAPIFLALLLTQGVWDVILSQSADTLFWTYLFGVMWGMGGLTFGLALRYLGMSLGMGVALGYCAAVGTLAPPIAKSIMPDLPGDTSIGDIIGTTPGLITLAGVLTCLVGIGIAAYAGLIKEREMPPEEKKKAIAEFNFPRGIAVATFSGIMSACFAFALTAGNPIGEASLQAGTEVHWTGLPKLVVVLLGGFTTNFIWCVILNVRNKTGYEYLAKKVRVKEGEEAPENTAIPQFNNYFFSALAGITWYLQFFFYTIGETQMGAFGFASWTMHMASIIIFSTLWGVYLKEWKGASKKAHLYISIGIAILILSTVIIGYATWLKGSGGGGH